MTRKHFEEIAEAIRTSPHLDETCRSAAALAIMPALERINPRFNRSRFWEACGFE